MPLFTRPDGTLARDVPDFRRMMPYLFRTRNESVVYFKQQLDLTKTLPFIEKWNATKPRRITVFHMLLYAAIKVLHEWPRMNRFVAARRIWQRDGIWISFSAKKALSNDAPIVVLKRRFEPATTFDGLLEMLYADLDTGRSADKSSVDKEVSVLLKLPGFLLRILLALQRCLDGWNLLPGFFIRTDPFYASVFIANLGSVKLEPAYHHLYEYGTIPLFATLGRVKRVPAARDDGTVTTMPVCEIKYTFDERVEDGLYCLAALERCRKIIEDPEAHVTAPK